MRLVRPTLVSAILATAPILTAVPSAASAQQPAPDRHLARNLAAACANCHGTNGAAVGDGDALAGMPQSTLVKTLKDFRDGKKPATVMHQIAKGYTEPQMELIAGYFAQQPAKK